VRTMRYTILFVDDEPEVLTSLRMAFEGKYRVLTAQSGREALELLRQEDVAVVIADQRMPGMTGAEMLAEAQKISPKSVRMVLTAYTDVDDLMSAINQGQIYRYILKPWEPEELEQEIKRAVELYSMAVELERKRRELEEANRRLAEAHRRLEEENILLRREVARRYSFGEVVGESPEMKRILELAAKAATSSLTVLISGETGTGKELVAKVIHANGPRRDRPFLSVNCAALPEALLESELFGHRKGAFTGATEDRKGLFEAADGGTLFLDEVGEMSPSLQAKLLRALETGEVRRLGETQIKRVDVRVIAATNRDLEKDVRDGRFRRDLFYRLNIFPIRIPPLRERREDIPLLAGHFLKDTGKRLSPEALDLLVKYDWPGNVRELKNEMERAAVLAEGNVIGPDVLSDRIRTSTKPSFRGTLREILDRTEREVIERVLKECKGNRSEAARRLGLSRWSLLRKMERLGIK